MSVKKKIDPKWLGLSALIPAVAMVFADQTILPVALPTIQQHLHASNTELWWCINSYLLVSAVLLLSGGKIGDRIGYRKAFLIGMIIFAFSSALCGLSFNVYSLIGARGLQGIGAALMIPASSPLLMSLFPPSERGKAIGINVSVSSLFLIFGPLIGGYFTQLFSWRWIFWVNLPLAVAGLILVPLLIPPSQKGKQQFDLWGFFFFILSCSSLVTLIMQSGQWGWYSKTSLFLLLLCLVSSIFLFWREKHATHPFIDLSLYRHPVYKAVNISIFATQFVLMITVYRAFFFQEVFDWSPLKSGTVFFLTSTPVLFMSPIGGWIADRSGSKVPIAIGFTLLISSFFWLAFLVQDSLPILLTGFFAFSLGVPLILTPSYSAAMTAVPPQKAGTAFGILATVRALSATLGVAIIASFANHIQARSFERLAQTQESTLPLSQIELISKGGKAAVTSMNLAPAILNDLKESQIMGFFYTHLSIGFILILAFAFVFVFYHRKASHHLPETPGEGWD